MFLFYPLLIGLIAAIVDITPMILRKMNPYSIGSAFVFHLILPSLLYLMPIFGSHWLKGALFYLILSLPVLILIAKEEKKAVPIVALNTIVIGSLVGWILSFL